MFAHVEASCGPLQMMFKFVPPWRDEKFFVAGSTSDPWLLFQVLAAPAGAGLNGCVGPSSHPIAPSPASRRSEAREAREATEAPRARPREGMRAAA
jgi:hypothetical protein